MLSYAYFAFLHVLGPLLYKKGEHWKTMVHHHDLFIPHDSLSLP